MGNVHGGAIGAGVEEDEFSKKKCLYIYIIFNILRFFVVNIKIKVTVYDWFVILYC